MNKPCTNLALSHISTRNTRNSRNSLEPQGFDLLRNDKTQHVTTEKHVTSTVKNSRKVALTSNLSTALKLSTALFLGLALASCDRPSYAKDLSNSLSVTPERHSGFFVPKICIDPQSVHLQGASVTATQTRLKSLYEGMTRQNKSVMANMSGASKTARVNPLTSLNIGELLKTQLVLGGNHA